MKRAFDLVFALCALVAVSPVLLALVVALLFTGRRPVLYRQVRSGRDGVPFTILKLRTMTDDRDEHGRLLPDADRITGMGKWLRSSSLDELPQLVNVVLGNMSLVGPRPLPPSYLPRYTPAETRRHAVRPGLTGWAQIHGRNTLSWDERLSMDAWYVEHRSPALDARILISTFALVILRRGVNASDDTTMPELRPERSDPTLFRA